MINANGGDAITVSYNDGVNFDSEPRKDGPNKTTQNNGGAGIKCTIAGVLRIAQGSGKLPVVIFIADSGGFNANTDVWDRQFQEMGISTFTLDGFAARGIQSLVTDQSKLGRLNMIVDLYRSLAVLTDCSS